MLERACIVSQDGAIGPVFEGDMPPKNDPQKWCLQWHHNWNRLREDSLPACMLDVFF
jgi:hypothetical protein